MKICFFTLLVTMTISVSCANKNPAQRFEEVFGFSLPKTASIKNYIDNPEYEIVYEISIRPVEMVYLKSSLKNYSKWHIVSDQQTFYAGTTVIKGNASSTQEFALATMLDGRVPVLIYDHEIGVLYAIIADGMM